MQSYKNDLLAFALPNRISLRPGLKRNQKPVRRASWVFVGTPAGRLGCARSGPIASPRALPADKSLFDASQAIAQLDAENFPQLGDPAVLDHLDIIHLFANDFSGLFQTEVFQETQNDDMALIFC